MSIYPLAVHVCGINKVSAMAAVGIQDQVGLGFIGVATKDIAAKAERVNYEVGLRDSDHLRRLRHNGRYGTNNGRVF